MRCQRRLPGQTRRHVGTAVIKEIERHLALTMAQYGVSRSFVIAVALADFFGVSQQEQFVPQPKSKRATLQRVK